MSQEQNQINQQRANQSQLSELYDYMGKIDAAMRDPLTPPEAKADYARKMQTAQYQASNLEKGLGLQEPSLEDLIKKSGDPRMGARVTGFIQTLMQSGVPQVDAHRMAGELVAGTPWETLSANLAQKGMSKDKLLNIGKAYNRS
jgi:hypothetical protein